MLVGSRLGMELVATGLAGDFRCPMPHSVHMLGRCALEAKGSGASFAIVARSPVSTGVHVLVAGTLGAKGGWANLAFGPVAIVGHMFFAVLFVCKLHTTRRTLILVLVVVVIHDVEPPCWQWLIR